jgi:fibronectin type 3 domain-containing protein
VPGAPTGLTATAGNGQVALAWTAPASNGGSAITGYRIYRGTSSGAETLLITTAAVTTYTDTAVVNGTSYFYQVTAVNDLGESVRSTEASARPAAAPGAPTNPSAKPDKTRGVDLSWSAPSSNGGSAITGYRIYRSTASGTEVFLTAVGTTTSFVDTSTTKGVRYYYKVSAVNAIGESVRSPEANSIAK